MLDSAPSNGRLLRFGAFELDVRAGELRKHGIRVRLGEQPFRILLMLLERPGKIVLRDDIRQRLWPNNTIVEFDHSINAAINRLRSALGETADRQRHIETVGSRGYRFVGDVDDSSQNIVAPAVQADECPAAAAENPSGRIVANYRILEELGAGGMGVVYRAQDLRLGRDVALKSLPDEVASDPIARQRFEREARSASALNHPNLCAIYGVEESDGRLFLVMELIEGTTLEARLSAGRMTRSEALSVATQICSVLDAAHRRGLVNRDIKPANVMLTESGVKVLDFGLAKMQAPLPAVGEDIDGITEPGMLIGTLQYMSPEQAQGKEADARSDIFSFGLVLYEMLSGRPAFDETNRAQLIAAILERVPEWNALPPDLAPVIKKCLAKDPALRWQNAEELREILSRARIEPTRPKSRMRWVLEATAVSMVFVAGFLLADRPHVDMSHVRFTPMVMDPGYNGFPSWSPDGRSFAYMHSGVLMRRSVEAAVPTRLTPGSAAVLFSKNGARLFYTRETAPATGRKLWTIPITGGEPRPLPAADLGGGYLSDGITMSPDGKAIIALKAEAGGKESSLQSSSPPGEPWRRLPCPALHGTGVGHLRFSPNGRQLLIVLQSQVWALAWPSEGRLPRRVFASTPVVAADWMADNRHVLMSLAGTDEGQGGGLFIGDTRSGRQYPLEIQDSHAFQLSAGPGDNFLINYSEGDSDIIEIPLDGSPWHPLIATKRAELAPEWSHSGDQLAYLSARNGPRDIWIWSPAQDLHRMLVTPRMLPGAQFVAGPVFSPDDKHIAFSAGASGAGSIWVAAASEGTPVQVLSPGRGAALPSWSPDGDWLAYRANVNGKMFLEKVRLGDPERPVTIAETVQGVRPVWSPDGRWITLATPRGVSLVSPDGRLTKHVHGPVTSWTSSGWSRDGKTLYLAVTDGWADPIASTLWAIDSTSGLERAVGHYFGVVFGGGPQMGLSPSPDGKSLTVTSTKPYTYIWLMEGLLPPKTLWQRLLSR